MLLTASIFFFSCSQPAEKEEPKATGTATEVKPAIDLPYSPSYSSNFTQEIPDAHLKTVLESYKYWETGDFDKLGATLGDSVWFANSRGEEKMYARNDLMTMWKTSRDSLSGVKIDMAAWQKMKSDKGHNIIATWYRETDTYKTGKVDSLDYHDLNITDSTGKIVWYSQYRKPAPAKK